MTCASDLPETWGTPIRMATALVTYMKDDTKVRQAVRDQFGTSPGLMEIARLRKQHTHQRKVSTNRYSTTAEPIDSRDQARVNQIVANKRFLNALYLSYPGRRPKK